MANYEYILNLNDDDFVNYIKNTDNVEELLKNSEIKNKVINSKQKYVFVWTVQQISENAIKSLLDDEGVELLLNSADLETKLNGLIQLGPIDIEDVLSRKDVSTAILKSRNLLTYLYSETIGKETSKSLIKCSRELNMDSIEILSNLSSENKIDIVDDFEKYIGRKIKMEDIRTFDRETIQHLVNTNSDLDFIDLSFYQIKQFVEKGVEFPSYITKSRKFNNTILEISEPGLYREFINSYEKNHEISTIEELRNNYYDNLIDTIDNETGLLNKYANLKNALETKNKKEFFLQLQEALDLENTGLNASIKYDSICEINYETEKDKIIEKLKEISDQEINEILIDRNFNDFYTNVLYDIKEVVSFNKENMIVDKEVLEVLSKVSNIDSLDVKEKIELYNSMKNKNYISDFYDAVRESKNTSYSMIKDSILNHEKDTNLLNHEKTDKYGVDVYELDGQDFNALVHCTSLDKSDAFRWKDRFGRPTIDGLSCSVISNNNITTYRDPEETITLGFDTFNIDNVVHLSKTDSFSSYSRKSNKGGSNRINEIVTPEELDNRTISYNEMVISTPKYRKEDDEAAKNIEPLIPTYLLCYDNVTDIDAEIAKQNNLYIVLVNTEKYKRKEGSAFENKERYVDSYYEEVEEISARTR